MSARLLVASLGNPAPYAHTLHSAGHTLLESIRVLLSYPPFSRDALISPGLVSKGPLYTLYQSPSYMNTSGPAVAKAWKSFLRDIPTDERSTARLVVVHDEMESPLGKIKVKEGGSARGHNGLKSCQGSLGGVRWVRMGVGIGRPESRESRDVSAFVLRKIGGREAELIRGGSMNACDALQKLAADGR